jgi:tetratricopeptide (TPR) repeat protein
MERTKCKLILICFLLIELTVNGSNRQDIYNAYVQNSMTVWKGVIDKLSDEADKNNELLLELVNYQYGYIGYCLGTKQKEEASVYLNNAEANLVKLENNKVFPAKIAGYKSAFYGFHIGLNIFSAPLLGPKSGANAREAIALDGNDYFGYVQAGNVQFHAPALMGGSKAEAVKCYLKAQSLMEQSSQDIAHDWNYLSLLVSLAKAYESIDDYINAKLIYEKLLGIEPNFIWVKTELYPKLLKQFKK